MDNLQILLQQARFAALLQNNDTIKPDTQDRIRFCEKRILNKDSSSRKQQNTTIMAGSSGPLNFTCFFAQNQYAYEGTKKIFKRI
nr:hypothetical protein BAU18_00260 [Enterococcus diestrammenae]